MLTFATSTLLFVSCGLFSNENVTPDNNTVKPFVKSEIQKLYENSFNGKTIIMNGDTTIENKPIKLHETPKDTDIKNLLNKDGTFKMVSIGGGLTAGARDGGLYRNGQLTSFVNLITIQMKTEFKQPLFNEKDFNGFGYKVLSSMSNGVPKYKTVSNNLAILKSEPIIELNPFKGEIDNWGVPFMGVWSLRYDRNLTKPSYIDYANPYKSRILSNIDKNYGENNVLYEFQKLRFDFFTLELGLDDYITGLFDGKRFSEQVTLSSPAYQEALAYSKRNNAKGIVLNVPDVFDFPFINWVSLENIRKINQSEIYVKATNSTTSTALAVPQGSYLLANPLSDSLLNSNISQSKKRGLAYNNPLEWKEIYTLDKVNALKTDTKRLNDQLNYDAQNLGYPIVDLYIIYKKIAFGDYITNDGLRVNKDIFFTSDGISPSAFGQAIIANECIKTINEFYKTNIPFIITGFYLNK